MEVALFIVAGLTAVGTAVYLVRTRKNSRKVVQVSRVSSPGSVEFVDAFSDSPRKSKSSSYTPAGYDVPAAVVAAASSSYDYSGYDSSSYDSGSSSFDGGSSSF